MLSFQRYFVSRWPVLLISVISSIWTCEITMSPSNWPLISSANISWVGFFIISTRNRNKSISFRWTFFFNFYRPFSGELCWISFKTSCMLTLSTSLKARKIKIVFKIIRNKLCDVRLATKFSAKFPKLKLYLLFNRIISIKIELICTKTFNFFFTFNSFISSLK